MALCQTKDMNSLRSQDTRCIPSKSFRQPYLLLIVEIDVIYYYLSTIICGLFYSPRPSITHDMRGSWMKAASCETDQSGVIKSPVGMSK